MMKRCLPLGLKKLGLGGFSVDDSVELEIDDAVVNFRVLGIGWTTVDLVADSVDPVNRTFGFLVVAVRL